MKVVGVRLFCRTSFLGNDQHIQKSSSNPVHKLPLLFLQECIDYVLLVSARHTKLKLLGKKTFFRRHWGAKTATKLSSRSLDIAFVSHLAVSHL